MIQLNDIENKEYIQNWFDQKDLIFIGKYYKETESKGCFKDIHDMNGASSRYENGDELIFQLNSELSKLNQIQKSLVNGNWYEFKAQVASKKIRNQKKNPHLLILSEEANTIKEFNPTEILSNLHDAEKNIPLKNRMQHGEALKIISNEVSPYDDTFIFELIQNADDYPQYEGSGLEITFDLKEKSLVLKHNGGEFDLQNVVAICSVNSGDKKAAKNKIGFKGIGFKSVFQAFNNVYINSGLFSFRFDEIYWRNQGIQLSWSTTPIPTIEDEYSEFLDKKNNVNFVFTNNDIERSLKEIKTVIKSSFHDDRVILFLREVNKINFLMWNEEPITLEVKKDDWIVENESKVTVHEDIQKELNIEITERKNKKIPVKYLDITETEIGFAFKCENNFIQNLSDATVHSYLPTKLNLGFGFIINSNFIPDGSRTSLHDLEWNRYLFKESGLYFLNKLSQLIEKGFDVSSVMGILPDFKELINRNEQDKVRLSYVNKFLEGLKFSIDEVAFLPTNSKSLCKLSQIVFDETGVSSILTKNEFLEFNYPSEEGDYPQQDNELETCEKYVLSDELTEDAKICIKKMMKYFKIGQFFKKTDLLNNISSENYNNWLFSEVENSFSLVKLCYEREYHEILKEKTIFLTSLNSLWTPGRIYKSLEDNVPLFESEIIHPELLEKLKSENIIIDFKEFSAVNHLKEYIDSKGFNVLTKEKNEEFWIFVFDYWEDLKDDDELLSELKDIHILIKSEEGSNDSFRKVSECYISKEYYDNENEIESIVRKLNLPDTHFISKDFICKNRNAKAWLKLFKKLKVKVDLQDFISNIIENLQNIADEAHFICATEIFEYWNKHKDNAEKGLSENQLDQVRDSLKIKTECGYLKPAECFLGDYFSDRGHEREYIPSLRLPVISKEYSRPQKRSDWRVFLLRIECLELSDISDTIRNKLKYFENQNYENIEYHMTVLKEFSNLYKKEKKHFPKESFNILLTDNSTEENLEKAFPDKIHFSSVYKPTLDIQSDEEVNSNFNFLYQGYDPKTISKRFLKDLGVIESFTVHYEEQIKLEDCKDYNYKKAIQSSFNYYKFLQGRDRESIRRRTFITNYISVPYLSLLKNEKYYKEFLIYLLKLDSKKILPTRIVVMRDNGTKLYNQPEIHYLEFILRNLPFFPTGGDVSNEIKNLISFSLREEVIDANRIPEIDFTQVKIDDMYSLEEIIGIPQNLDKKAILDLLRLKTKPITLQQFENLNIVEILKKSNMIDGDSSNYFLFSKSNKWTNIKNLCIPKEDLEIPNKNILHEDLIGLAEFFSIPELGKSDLIVRFDPQNVKESKEIHEFFNAKARYIAFDYEPNDEFKNEELALIDSIEEKIFYEVSKINGISNEVTLSEAIDFGQFHVDNDRIYYVGKWIENEKLLGWILESIVGFKGFTKEYLVSFQTRKERDIIRSLEDKNPQASKILGKDRENENLKVQREINEVCKTLEETEWSSCIPILEEIMNLDLTLSEKEIRAYNLIAKIKLAKSQKNISFDPEDLSKHDFNILRGNKVNYYVHSARGAFAYIPPSELIKMRDEGYKMALDFGMNKEIKIYHSAEEVLKLNTNHLLLYSKEKPVEDMIAFCGKNNDKNKHLLLIDRENTEHDLEELLRITNPS